MKKCTMTSTGKVIENGFLDKLCNAVTVEKLPEELIIGYDGTQFIMITDLDELMEFNGRIVGKYKLEDKCVVNYKPNLAQFLISTKEQA